MSAGRKKPGAFRKMKTPENAEEVTSSVDSALFSTNIN